jgi:hypothetical protein
MDANAAREYLIAELEECGTCGTTLGDLLARVPDGLAHAPLLDTLFALEGEGVVEFVGPDRFRLPLQALVLAV